MKPNILTFLMVPILLSGCSESVTPKPFTEDVIVPVTHEYSEISDYGLSRETIFDVDENKYYVYFYSLTCSHCEELKNFIIEKALNRGDIYFVKGTSKDQITDDPNKSIGAGNPGEIWILGYPSLLQISNQKCSKNLAGITKIKSELN